ncbi:MAG: RNA-binding protein [Thermoproteota archaeon]|nr:RNA-binding protein [Thermoproteota archaeon]
MTITNLQASLDDLHEQLKSIEERREKLITGTRKVVLLCGKSIVDLHRNEIREGEKKIEEARLLLNEFRPYAKTDLQRYMVDAEQEFVEASMLKSICEGSPLPLREELNVSGPSYITGILDTIGEIKRLIYDRMRTSQTTDVIRLFGLMQELYNAIYVLGVYDNLIPGLRRKLDISKMITEDVRAAVTEDSRRQLMINALAILEKKLKDHV